MIIEVNWQYEIGLVATGSTTLGDNNEATYTVTLPCCHGNRSNEQRFVIFKKHNFFWFN